MPLKTKSIILILLFAVALASCTPHTKGLPVSSQTPKPAQPITSPSPFAVTCEPMETSNPAWGTPIVYQTPSGKPLTVWKGIQVMPNAIAADGDNNSKGYWYTVHSTPDEAQKFYEKKMLDLGLSMRFCGGSIGDSKELWFQNGPDIVIVRIIPQRNGLLEIILTAGQ
jgi:hypothetical protein